MIGSRHPAKSQALGVGILTVAAILLGGCADDVGQGGLWECRAHAGPEPVELLDWRTEHDKPHVDVSCRVGVGIRAGWWQWHSFSADGCRSVAVRPSATAELPDGQSRSRRDAREPIVLNDDDIVTGFTFVDESSSPEGVIAGTTGPLCLLEFLGAERPSSP